jgi:MoCo/4Fe-4S cofactor protein with predicted Tat translocation signal
MEQKNYWKGLEELKQEPAFVEASSKEFSEELPLDEIFGSDAAMFASTHRRDFLKLMGFSISAAALAASCTIPVRQIIPYVFKPEEVYPGVANYYASSFIDGSDYCSILVKTREGRPIKIEGNNLSSVTQGVTSARSQAFILSLYDKTRLQYPAVNGEKTDWDVVDGEIKKQLDDIKSKGGNIRILSSTILSPSTKQVIADFADYYNNTKHIVYEPISTSAILMANEQSFGKKVIPGYRFDNAKLIVTFGADFLGTWISPTEYIKQYTKNRKLDPSNPKMNKLVSFESRVTLTGSNADMRVPIKPSEQGIAVLSLYNKIASKMGVSSISGVPSISADDKISGVADELIAAKGAALVVSGVNDVNVQTVVNAINDLLGSYGNTIDLDNYSNAKQGVDSDLMDLIDEMNNKKIDALIVYNSNPGYASGFSKQFADAVKNVGLTISLNDRLDETASLLKYACPDNHNLESWNDAEPKKGMYSLCQPTIAPLFNTRQAQNSLLKWSDSTEDYYTYIQKYWEKNIYPSVKEISTFQSFWDNSLKNGVYENAPEEEGRAAFKGDLDSASSNILKNKPAGGIEVVLYEKVGIGNGKYADNPWLQEMPDPITKICWDNYVTVSYKWAKKFFEDNSLAMNLSYDDKNTKDDLDYNMVHMVTVTAGDFSVELPLVVQPGQLDGTASIALGYGRTKAGRASNGVGKDVYPLVGYNDGTFSYVFSNAIIKPTGKTYQIARTQSHNTLEGRPIINEYSSLSEYKSKHAGDGEKYRDEHEETRKSTIYKKIEYQGIKWGMSIDLNSCVGCGTCIIACNAENNVPMVGQHEVYRAHEMHWMRIDRYYSGDIENPEVTFQPMLCQHCENAPCENVCPVSATNHSSEGLNQMIYNRCVGTKYCLNNCPYKVRRFNWFDWTMADTAPWNALEYKDEVSMTDDITRMVLNPDVTVRSRGVMEKCSFCVQKLQEGKLNAKKEGRALQDGDAKTACQTSCPAEAIKFGNMLDENSAIAKERTDDRTFYVLDDLHTLPSIGYLTKVRNTETLS